MTAPRPGAPFLPLIQFPPLEQATRAPISPSWSRQLVNIADDFDDIAGAVKNAALKGSPLHATM